MARIEESIEIRCPVDKVFAYTTDAKSWLKWQPFPEAEQTSPGPMGVGATTRGTIHMMGLNMKWTAKVTEYETDKKFGKSIASGPIANEQHNTYEPVDGGTKFTVVYDVKVGGVMKLFSSVMVSTLRQGLKKALGKLKVILEAQA